MANPRGMRKPPYAPTAPAMPMHPAAALRAVGSVARRVDPGPEDRGDHPVGRAVADAGADEQHQEATPKKSAKLCACRPDDRADGAERHDGERRDRDARAAEPVGDDAAERPGERADQRAEEARVGRRTSRGTGS